MENKKSEMNIYQKLAKARVMLDVNRGGRNDYSKYSYFELDDFIPLINKVCDDLGLFTKFSFDVGENAIATLTIIDTDETDEKIDFTIPTQLAKISGASDIQNLGGTNTYLKRYLYMNAFEIAEPDKVEEGKKQEQQEQKAKPKAQAKAKVQPRNNSEARVGLILFVNQNKLDIKEISKHYGLNGSSSDEDFSRVLEELKSRKWGEENGN